MKRKTHYNPFFKTLHLKHLYLVKHFAYMHFFFLLQYSVSNILKLINACDKFLFHFILFVNLLAPISKANDLKEALRFIIKSHIIRLELGIHYKRKMEVCLIFCY